MFRKSSIFFFISTLLPTKLLAFDTDYVIGYSAEYVSNIRYAAQNEESDFVQRVSGTIRTYEQNQYLDSRTDAHLAVFDYRDNTFADGAIASLDSINSIFLSGRNLMLNIDDHLAYIPRSTSATNTPDNLQQVNLFSIGPLFRLNITPVDSTEFEYRHEIYNEEKTNNDIKRDIGKARLIHQFSPISQIQLNYEYRDTDYTHDTSVDFDRDDWFLRFEYKTINNQYHLEGGRTEITRVDGTTAEGNRSRFGLSRRISPTHSISLYYRNELSDIAQELGSSLPSIDQTTSINPNLVTTSNITDVFEVKSYGGEYQISDTRGFLRVSASTEDIDYQQTSNDEENINFGVELNHRFSQRTSIDFNYAYQDRELINIQRFDITKSGRIAFNYNTSRELAIVGYVSYQDRNSTNPSSQYEVLIVGVGLTYNTGQLLRRNFPRY